MSQVLDYRYRQPEKLPPFPEYPERAFPELYETLPREHWYDIIGEILGTRKKKFILKAHSGFVTAAVSKYLGTDEETGIKLHGPWNHLKHWVPKLGWCFWNGNLVTDVGEDYFHAQIYTNNAAGGVGVNFIALSTTLLTPAASDTILSGEITSGVNAGLARVIASTRTHTASANTTTLTNTFTSSATVGAPGVQSSALFNAGSSGTMGHIANLPSASGAMATSDQIAITWLMTIARP